MPSDLDISVCILTYRRPEPLRRLLSALAEQAGPLPAFEIVIVDNDAAGSALAASRQYEGRLPIRYTVEPVPGIAPARNRSVKVSTGRYLAYIDDDCVVGPEWLREIHAAALASGAEGVIGPVVRKIEGEPPGPKPRADHLQPPPPRAGMALPWYLTHTQNSCLRRSALPGDAPFDPALALIGGEDVDLFARMIDAGARLMAIAGPVVEEYRPAARSSVAWLIRRTFRNGGTVAHVEWRNASGVRLAWLVLCALGQAAWQLMRTPFALFRSRSAAFACFLVSVRWFGMAAWAMGIVYREYGR